MSKVAIEVRSDEFTWGIIISDGDISLTKNSRFVAHYLRSDSATIKVLREGFKLMLRDIADCIGLSVEELTGVVEDAK